MKTIVQQITFMCPTGLGNPNASCRFHRASDNLPEDNMCPTCKLELVKSTLPEDKMTKTVMGEEDIEVEIEDRDEVKHRVKELAEIDSQIETMDTDGEFPTTIKKEKTRTQRKESVETEIARKKSDGYFLVGATKITAYRNKRKADIVEAIKKAKELED